MEQPEKRYRKVKHEGPLTMSSLDRSFPHYIFRPASQAGNPVLAQEDPFRMGWEHMAPEDSYEFVIKNLSWATAEGVVNLAAIVECLRNRPNAKVVLDINSVNPKARQWISALQLSQLVDSKWEIPAQHWSLCPSDCYAFPLWRFCLEEAQAAVQTARFLSEAVEILLEDLDAAGKNETPTAVRFVIQEALLNIIQHAYRSQKPIAIASITVSPIPREEDLKKFAYVSNEELQWLEAYKSTDRMLEVAVADYGRGVPLTLWRSYYGVDSISLDRLKTLSLGSRNAKIERARIHHKIALWAFDHESTCKTVQDFPDQRYFLNWRGLHRALNTVAGLAGCIVMRTGQARTGYVFREGASHSLKPGQIVQQELPGTSLVLRFPLVESQHWVSVPGTNEMLSPTQVHLEKVVKVSDLPSVIPKLQTGNASVIGITHPFTTFQTSNWIDLYHQVRTVPPNYLQIHLFARLDSPLARIIREDAKQKASNCV